MEQLRRQLAHLTKKNNQLQNQLVKNQATHAEKTAQLRHELTAVKTRLHKENDLIQADTEAITLADKQVDRLHKLTQIAKQAALAQSRLAEVTTKQLHQVNLQRQQAVRRSRLQVRRINELTRRIHEFDNFVFTHETMAIIDGPVQSYKQWRLSVRYLDNLRLTIRNQRKIIEEFEKSFTRKVEQATTTQRSRIGQLETVVRTLDGISTKRLLGALVHRISTIDEPDDFTQVMNFVDAAESKLQRIVAQQRYHVDEAAEINMALPKASAGVHLVGRSLYGTIVALPTTDFPVSTVEMVSQHPQYHQFATIDDVPVGFKDLTGAVSTVLLLHKNITVEIGDVVRGLARLSADGQEYVQLNKRYEIPTAPLSVGGVKDKEHSTNKRVPESAAVTLPEFIENEAILREKRIMIVSSQSKHQGVQRLLIMLGAQAEFVRPAKREIQHLRQTLNTHQYDLILVDKSHTSHAAVEAVHLRHVDWAQVLQKGLSTKKVVKRAYDFFESRVSRGMQ